MPRPLGKADGELPNVWIRQTTPELTDLKSQKRDGQT